MEPIIGPAEAAAGQVSVRLRDGRKLPAMPAAEAIGQLGRQIGARSSELRNPAG
jgi:threonyl-tRNA synthetase